MTTLDELKKKWYNAMKVSEQAIILHPSEYYQLKQLTYAVAYQPLDISEYYSTANMITKLLKPLVLSGENTIFRYFYDHINPCLYGDVRYFRAVCLDFTEQVKVFEQWRCEARHIVLIKG